NRSPPVMFLIILFVFLSYNFSRDFLQAPWEATSLMNVAVSFSRITFPCCVWHFVFGKRRRMTVFSYITFRFRLVNHGMKYGRNGKNCSIQWVSKLSQRLCGKCFEATLKVHGAKYEV